MDYTLIALFGLIVLAVVVSARYHITAWSGHPGYQYQRVISIGVVGLSLTFAGAMGLDVRHVHGFFQGTQWADSPIWWQLGTGVGMVALAVFMGRRVPANATRTPVVR